MDKGIVYLICTILIVALLAIQSAVFSKEIAKQCVGRTVTVVASVTPTPALVVSGTATPTAALKQLQKAVK